MSMNFVVLICVTFVIVGVIIIALTLYFMNHKYKKNYLNKIDELEINKNQIISGTILSELNKVESLINNDELREKFNEWQDRFKIIKNEEVPKITDSLIETENLYELRDYKGLKKKIVEIELNIYIIKVRSNTLLDEVRNITLSETKNREIVSRLKTEYREILNKYNKKESEYKEISSVIKLQFENVDKLFSAFELTMENNQYTEISKIVKALSDLIGNLQIVIEETPTIIFLGRNIIPLRMNDIKSIYKKMTKDGYQLSFMNLEYNVKETEKKIADIFDKLNVLNLEDSIFELKTILDYFDSLYNDFDKEKLSKKSYEEYSRNIALRLPKLEKVIKDLLLKIEDIKYSYDLSDEDVSIIKEIKDEIVNMQKDYDLIITSHQNKTFAYSRLAKEMELLNVRLTKTKDKLELAVRTFGSLKEDELRAREQLDEIKKVLKEAKYKINSFKLPVIPKNYFVELSEASDAINEIAKELDKRVINIGTLNLRVDTARDLVLKLYNTSSELVKSAWMAEMSIVYGNRYRPVNKDINLGLIKAESSFYKGDFRKSLEYAVSAISIVEPNIHKRLLEEYQK